MFTANNIGHMLVTSTDDEWEAGLAWYPDTNALAKSLTPSDVRIGAGVISALSPQSGWATNQKWARESVLAGTGVGNTMANRNKASRILAGESIETVFATAPKTRNFALTIADPTIDAVVLDRHAMSVAAGRYLSASESAKVLNRKGEYDRIADMYRVVADNVGVLVSAVQAITWVSFREDVGVSWFG